MWPAIYALKRQVETAFGIHIFRNTLPFGCDALRDLKRAFPEIGASRVVVDIGAHKGESVARYRRAFPNAHIHAFEPATDNRRALEEATKTDSSVSVHPFAVGNADGTATLYRARHSAMHSLAPTGQAISSEPVISVTLDSFCRQRSVDRIGLCKIDTEGFDLEILRGARGLLASQRIDFVQVETSLRRDVKYFVPLWTVDEFMHSVHYELFGIYEQQPCWSGRRSMLFCNAVYVRTSLVDSADPL